MRASTWIALLGLTLSIGMTHAAEPAVRALDGKERQTFLKRMQANLSAWSFQVGDASYDEAAPDYSKRPDAVFMDPIPPLEGYRGWDEYRQAVPTWIKQGIRQAEFTVDAPERFRAWRHGDVVWNVMYCGVALVLPGDSEVRQKCRGTTIWEWEGDAWRLAHETFSIPASPGKAGFAGERRADPRVEPHPEFLARAKTIAQAWGAGPVSDLASRLKKHYAREATIFTPWDPLQAYRGWAAFETGIQANLAPVLQKISIQVNDDLEAHQRGRLAWSHATIRVVMESNDGTRQSGNGRQTLIWLLTAAGWRIVHEHFAFPQAG